jgi:hypothetical protein
MNNKGNGMPEKTNEGENAHTGHERRAPVQAGELEALVERAIRETLADVRLVDGATHQRHHDYIEAVLAREADRAALRKAVIEKTLAGLVWMAIAGSITYIANHWRP